MIEDPANDRECLGQFTEDAREIARSARAYKIAAQLRTKRNVMTWLQQKPQSDDDGRERVQVTMCDVAQRDRLFADDPNCIERARDAMALFEVIDPKGRYKLVTVDRPARHTALVEWDGKQWEPVDLFPRRNAGARNVDWKSVGQDTLGVVHGVGGGILKMYGLGSVSDSLGNVYKQQGWVKPDKKPAPPPQQQRPTVPPNTPAARPAPSPAPRPVVVAAPPPAPPAPPTPPAEPPAPQPRVTVEYQPYAGGDNAPDEPASFTFWWPPRSRAGA